MGHVMENGFGSLQVPVCLTSAYQTFAYITERLTMRLRCRPALHIIMTSSYRSFMIRLIRQEHRAAKTCEPADRPICQA